eukprot:2697877-Pleurochrysis_carterae.AAC.1
MGRARCWHRQRAGRRRQPPVPADATRVSCRHRAASKGTCAYAPGPCLPFGCTRTLYAVRAPTASQRGAASASGYSTPAG